MGDAEPQSHSGAVAEDGLGELSIASLPLDVLFTIYKLLPTNTAPGGRETTDSKAFLLVCKAFRDAVRQCATYAAIDSERQLAELTAFLPLYRSVKSLVCTNCVLDDAALVNITSMKPRSLTLTGSVFSSLTSAGLLQSLRNLGGSLEVLELVVCEMTDASLRALSGFCTGLKELVLEDNPAVTDEGLSALAGMPSLERLSLSDCECVTDDGVCRLLAALPRLTWLGLGGCDRLTDVSAAAIARLTGLRTLDLSGCFNMTSAGIRGLSQLTRMEELFLADHPLELTGEAVKDLVAAMPSLVSLVLTNCREMEGEGLVGLSQLQHLTELDVSDCDLVDDAVLEACGHCPALRKLCLAGTSVSDAGLAALAGDDGDDDGGGQGEGGAPLPPIETLDLADCPNIAGPGFESLRRLTTLKDVLLEGNEQLTLTSQWMHGLQLRELEAHSCGVDGPVVEAISRMSELRTLNISECHGVSASDLLHLTQMTSLYTLHLCGLEDLVTDSLVIALVQACPDLQNVGLARSDITDEALKAVVGLKYLKLLDVSDCDAITGHGFAHLPDSPVLEDLNVSLCHKIQDSALRHIYRAKSLNALSLAECWNLTNAAMRGLSSLGHLRRLDLTKCTLLDNGGLSALRHLHRLDNLQIADNRSVNARGLTSLTHLSSTLTNLDISGIKISDGGFRQLSGLTALEKLVCEATGLRGDGFKYLSGLRRLTDITVSHSQRMNNAGFRNIVALRSLMTIDMQSCRGVSDYGIQVLTRLTNLRELNVSDCPNITMVAIQEIQAMPTVQDVVWTGVADNGDFLGVHFPDDEDFQDAMESDDEDTGSDMGGA